MYDEKDHAHEGHKMSVLTKVLWVIAALYASLILVAATAPTTTEYGKRSYPGPLTCEPYDGKLLCDKPATP